MESMTMFKLKSDKETQCNFYAKLLSNKSCQVKFNDRKASCSTKENNIDESDESTNKKRKLDDLETSIPIQQASKLTKVIDWLKGLKNAGKISQFVTYNEIVALNSNDHYLEITRSDIFVLNLGDKPIKFLIDEKGEASMIVAFRGVCSRERIFDEDLFLDEKAFAFLKGVFGEGYVLCPGVTNEALQKISEIKFTPKHIVKYDSPAPRISSQLCSVWFKPSKFTPDKYKDSKNHCNPCRNLSKHIKTLGNRVYASPSSKCPFKFLSPRSKSKRQSHLRVRRHRLFESNKKLKAKCNEYELTLSSSQSKELSNVTNIINKDFSNELNELFNQNPERSGTLKDIWEKDCARHIEQDKQQFQEDQLRNRKGLKGNKWSTITYRIALAIACRSHAAYEAIQSFGIIQLPSWRSVQRKMSKHLDGPGINFDYLKEQKSCYEDFIKEEVANGKLEPKRDGLLIFDEVKVTAKVIWNCKNHKLVGLAMTHEQLSSLDDIYDDLKSTDYLPKANYMLQFLWRDLTSDYDIVGPYFASENTTDSHFIAACLFEVLKAFQLHEFKVSALMCDGASSNLTLIKLTQNYQGAFGVKISSNGINVGIKPSFRNPFYLSE